MSNKNIGKLVTSSSEEDYSDEEQSEQPPKSKEEKLHDLKTPNQTAVAFNFEEEDCEYMVIGKDENIKLPRHLLKCFCDKFTLLPKEIDLSQVIGDDIISAFSFYLPRSRSEDDLDSLDPENGLTICETFGMPSLRKKIERELIDNANISGVEELLPNLHLAFKFHLIKFLSEVFARRHHFIYIKYIRKIHQISLNSTQLSLYFRSSLPKDFLYELVKNTIKKVFHQIEKENKPFHSQVKGQFSKTTKNGYVEGLDILNFLDMIYYDDQTIESSPKRREIYDAPYEYDTKGVIGEVTCGEDFEDRAILIVESKRINVKSFLLIDNSPVFKVMLHSTSFKEGQTKSIELPGKSLNEIVYLLEHLQFSKDINNSTNIVVLANLCQEYQIDWLLDKIENYLNVARIINLNTQLEYLQLVRKMELKDDTELALIKKITAYFPEIQSNPFFPLLDRSVKLKIALRRLRNILDQFVKNNLFIDTELKNTEKDSLIYHKERGLIHFFQNQ